MGELALVRDVVTAGFNTVSVLLGQAGGVFASKVDYLTGDYRASSTRAIAVGDFNGDKNPDLAVTNDIPDMVSVLLGRGDGTFLGHVDYPTDIDLHALALGV